MFSNYLKTAFRNLTKNKYYSLISIFSLGIAISCFIFTYAYFKHEMSYDSYHNNSGRIYRIIAETKIYKPVKLASTSELLAPELKKISAGFEYVARTETGREKTLRRGNILFREKNVFHVEQDFLNIFSPEFILGVKENALVRPNTVLLTKSIASKYFGTENPVGQNILINNKSYEVTGVVSDPPTNTHMKYTLLASFATIEPTLTYKDWTCYNYFTFIKLKEGVSAESFGKVLYNISEKYLNASYGIYQHHLLQPLTDIHINTELDWDIDQHTNVAYLYILLAVGILSLGMANINLINMSVSHSLNRSKEIGIRKAAGAAKASIIYQFFVESFLILLLSGILAVIVSVLFMPAFNKIAEMDFSFTRLFSFDWIILILALVFALSIIASIYPAIIISSVKPAIALKKFFISTTGGSRLKTLLMTAQYSVTIVLLICFAVMYTQTNYMKNKYLGFEKEQKLLLQIPSVNAGYDYLTKEFSGHKTIVGASISSAAMGGGVSFGSVPMPGEDPNSTNRKKVRHLFADANFIRNYKINLRAGDTSRIFNGGLKNGIIVNEKFAREFGWHNFRDAIGQTLFIPWVNKNLEIIGLVKDFNFAGLQETIEPMLIYDAPEQYRYITLDIKGNTQETLSFLKDKWAQIFPNSPFSYFFLDEYFNRNYNKDERIVNVFSIFSWIGIAIACFGLVGVTNFNIQRKVKEAGIRKVFGATVYNLLLVFVKRIILTILIAGVLASAPAYYFMDKWLGKYAYRIDLNIFFFIGSVFIILFISVLMVAYPLFKAASKNPIESLRYE